MLLRDLFRPDTRGPYDGALTKTKRGKLCGRVLRWWSEPAFTSLDEMYLYLLAFDQYLGIWAGVFAEDLYARRVHTEANRDDNAKR